MIQQVELWENWTNKIISNKLTSFRKLMVDISKCKNICDQTDPKIRVIWLVTKYSLKTFSKICYYNCFLS